MRILQSLIFINILLSSCNAEVLLVKMKASEIEKNNFKTLSKEQFEKKYTQKKTLKEDKSLEKIKIIEKCEYDKFSVFALINEGIVKGDEISKDKEKQNKFIGVLLKKLKKYTFLEYEIIEKELFIKGIDRDLLMEIKSVLKGRL